MAAEFDAVSTADTGAVLTLEWTHTPVGTPTAVVVSLATVAGQSFSDVTYGGEAMTQLTSLDAQSLHLELWGLADPPAGAQTVSATCTLQFIVAAAATVTGSGTSFATAFGAESTESGASGNPGGALSDVQEGSLSIDSAIASPGTLTADAVGMTQRWNFADGSESLQSVGSTNPGTGAVTFAWDQPADGPWLWSAVEVLAAVVATPTRGRISWAELEVPDVAPPTPEAPASAPAVGLNYSARAMTMAGL